MRLLTFFSIAYSIEYAIETLLQTVGGFDIDKILSTERVLSFLLIYFVVWAFPRSIWPFVVEQVKIRQKSDFNYKMAQLAAQEKKEETIIDILSQLAKTQEQLMDLLSEQVQQRR